MRAQLSRAWGSCERAPWLCGTGVCFWHEPGAGRLRGVSGCPCAPGRTEPAVPPRQRAVADAAPGMTRAHRSPPPEPVPPRPGRRRRPRLTEGPGAGAARRGAERSGAGRGGTGAARRGAERARRREVRAGGGGAVRRREGGCGMAEAPGAPHRTTGSTLLHPLSALLGIPLDQVRLRAAAGPGGILSAGRLGDSVAVTPCLPQGLGSSAESPR